MKTQTSVVYQQRLQRVINYIYQHLDADLTLEPLADVARLNQQDHIAWQNTNFAQKNTYPLTAYC